MFFHLQVFKPEGFVTPLCPITCGFCIFGAIFLMASAGKDALWRFGIVIGVCIVTYLLYGVHASDRHDRAVEAHFERYDHHANSDEVVCIMPCPSTSPIAVECVCRLPSNSPSDASFDVAYDLDRQAQNFKAIAATTKEAT